MATTLQRFVDKQKELLKLEREAEEEETGDARRCLSCEVIEVEAGLGGRSIVKLKLPTPSTNGHSVNEEGTLRYKQLRLSVGESIQLRRAATKDLPEPGDPVRGIVQIVTEKFITTSMDDFKEEWNENKVSLSKVPNDTTYKRMEAALDNLLARSDRLVDVCFGDTPPEQTVEDLSKLSFMDSNLNDSQKDAIKFVLRTKDIALILGPPGTGKTTTVVEVIRQAVKRKERVLVAAPSNIAVDNVVEKLSEHRIKMVRIGHPARLLPSVVEHSLDSRIHYSEGSKIVADIRKDINSVYGKIRRTKNRAERAQLRSELKSLQKELKAREDQTIRDIVGTSSVVCCTLTGAADRYLRGVNFDLVIIDEAAQAMEAACWIALEKAPKAILAGDPFQLPPTILSKKAQAKGLEVTLFERLYNKYKKDNNIHRMLTVQYRMNELIMRWSSDEFYEGKLVAHDSVKDHLLSDLPGVDSSEDETVTPLLLIDTAGCDFNENQTADSEESKSNEGEANLVVEHVKRLFSAGVREQDVAVIAPYSAQVQLLKSKLLDEHQFMEIGTVDGFQGREKEAIVISMVRSNSAGEVGFLSDQRRINVAITRARRHVAVVADSTTMRNNDFLARMIKYFEEFADHRSAEEYL